MRNIRMSGRSALMAGMLASAASSASLKPTYLGRSALVTRDPDYDRQTPEVKALADAFYQEIIEILEKRDFKVTLTSKIDHSTLLGISCWVSHGIPPEAFKGMPERIESIILQTKVNNKKFKNKKEKLADPLYYMANKIDMDKLRFA